MKRLIFALLSGWMSLTVGNAALQYPTASIPTPAGPRASCASFTTVADGQVWLSWIEPVAGGEHALKFSTFACQSSSWSPARTIAHGRNWTVSGADLPALVVQPSGGVTAVWAVNNPLPAGSHAHGATAASSAHDQHAAGHHAFFAQSKDHGITWSAPQRVSRESEIVEFVSLAPLPNGDLLAVWLDGRAKKSGGPQQLFSRLLGGPQRDNLVDASVCDCCPTALTAFLDGSALLSYRGRTRDEIRDVITVRYADGQWEKARKSTGENWKIAGCPVNGPRLVNNGPRVGRVWFTAAQEQASVFVSLSPDAGGFFSKPMRVDLGNPLGRPDTIVLRDGSQLVTWLETAGADASGAPGLYLRRYGIGGATQDPVRLAGIKETRAAGHPRIALVKDFGETPAQFLAAFTGAGETPTIETLLVTLPDAQLLADADNGCGCGVQAAEPAGYAIRAQVLETRTAGAVARVRHQAVPGVLKAGEREFKLTAEAVAGMKPGAEVLARIEQRDGAWVMFDVQTLAQPAR